MTTATSSLEKTGEKRIDFLDIASRFGAFIFLIVLCLIFAILEPAFFKPINIFNVLRQVSIIGLLAIGMTFVILTAGIDLSVGSLLALAGLVAAAVEKGSTGLLTGASTGEGGGYGLPAAIAAAIVVGLLGGLLQGGAISKFKVPAFIVTLGGLSAFRGAALVFSGGQPISAFGKSTVIWGRG